VTAASAPRAATADLESSLTAVLGRRGLRVAAVTARPSAYATSSAILELDVELEDGGRLSLLRKDVGPGGRFGQARVVKPPFVTDGLREVAVYGLLEDAGLGTARCYGVDLDLGSHRCWLYLERVRGVELFQVGDLRVWTAVAGWLARFHDQFAAGVGAAGSRLLRVDAGLLGTWLRRAAGNVPGPALERLAGVQQRAADILTATPVTLAHGECYASNVLVAEAPGPDGLRVCPVDWEMAALGPGLLDLAALSAGGWSARDRAAMVAAYRSALRHWDPPDGEFAEALAACRLHLALQWLGWSSQWEPPAAHATDWLAEALAAAEELGA
jgi:hypothetical protein